MFTKAKFHQIVTIVVMFIMLFSDLQPLSASAQGGDGIKRGTNPESGRVSFIGPESGRVVSASRTLGTFFRSEDPAMSWMKRFGPEFGLTDPERNLSRIEADRSDDGRVTGAEKRQGVGFHRCHVGCQFNGIIARAGAVRPGDKDHQ